MVGRVIGDDGIARLREAPTELIGGRFEIAGEAGTGGMGVVYRARDTATGAPVALKVMAFESRSGAARFAREGHVLAALRHPAIVSYVAHGETEEGEPWLAMEWLDGVSLARRLGEGPLEWRAAVTLGRRVAEALEHAHAAGVVHRDLKPANLFLAGGRVEDVKLLDFGVARAEHEGAGLTRTGEILGTPGYMAPEQARGGRDVGLRADLFSLGCVLYRAITGEPAFEGADALEALAKLVTHEPPPLRRFAPDAPAELERLIARMMAKAPGDRPASAREVAGALARAAAEAGEATADGRTPSAEELAATIEARSEVRGGHRLGDASATFAGVGMPRVSAPAPSVATSPRGRVAKGAAIGVVLVALAAGAALFEDDPAPSSEVSAPAGESVGEPARRACLAWIDALASAQHPDGTFGFERQREGHGWTTGQELFALARADGACGASPRHTVALRRGAAGLERFRTEGGYRGAGAEGGAVETGASAWAVLALVAIAERLDDAALRERALEARGALLTARTADGGFRLLPGEPAWPAHPYATMLALWALAESESLDRSAEAIAARRAASAWLESALREEGDRAMRATAGLGEQATWVLLRVRALTGEEPDAALLAPLARSILARCDLEGGGCRRPIDGDGAIALDRGTGEGGPNFITHWHPWATLASAALSAEDTLPGEARAELASVARWGAGEMDRGRAPLRTAASYRLAEYLFVASELARTEGALR